MERRLLRTLLGGAMIGLGLVQIGLYGVQGEWLPSVFGLLYSSFGVAYLWAEVYSVNG